MWVPAALKNYRAIYSAPLIVLDEKNGATILNEMQRLGLDELLEMVALQSEVLDLKANPDKPGRGHVVEAKLVDRLAIPRRFLITMREIWSMQPRYENRSGSRPFKLLEQPRFRAGYDFLCLRASVGEVPQELAHWWEKFQYADSEARNGMLVRETREGPAKKRRRRRRKTPGTDASGGNEA